MLNAIPLSHLFEIFFCCGIKEIILNHTVWQVIRRPKFPYELKERHQERWGGERQLLFSCRTNPVLYTLQTGSIQHWAALLAGSAQYTFSLEELLWIQKKELLVKTVVIV